MPTTRSTNRQSGKRLLAFGTLFSCQGAQSSHTEVSGRPTIAEDRCPDT
jgi:hypothetical protein